MENPGGKNHGKRESKIHHGNSRITNYGSKNMRSENSFCLCSKPKYLRKIIFIPLCAPTSLHLRWGLGPSHPLPTLNLHSFFSSWVPINFNSITKTQFGSNTQNRIPTRIQHQKRTRPNLGYTPYLLLASSSNGRLISKEKRRFPSLSLSISRIWRQGHMGMFTPQWLSCPLLFGSLLGHTYTPNASRAMDQTMSPII